MHKPSNTPTASFFPVEISGDAPLTMSSVEIAEITGKKHLHVLRDARRMLDELQSRGVSIFGSTNFESTYVDNQGKVQPCIRLPRRECLILVSGYNVTLRAKIIDRWEQLERNAATPSGPSYGSIDYSDPQILLGVLTHLKEESAKKDEIIAEQSKSVRALERLEAAEGEMCITDAAKTLDVKVKWLFLFMASKRWIYKRPGNRNWVAYADKMPHYLRHDDHLYIDSLGQERVATRVIVTAKGLVALAKLLDTPLIAKGD